MIVLASSSPRRRELLKLITEDFTVIPADIDESLYNGMEPKTLVETLSLKKAQAVFTACKTGVVIGADTVVCLDGVVFHKPDGQPEAAKMLRALSGKTHMVFTGVSIVAENVNRTFSKAAKVTFFALSDRDIETYLATGEPFDKAGAYGIQGKGALLISGIDGDFYTVMGLPVAALNRELLSLNIPL